MEHADDQLTPGQRRMLPAQRARKDRKFFRWAEEMRRFGWAVVPPRNNQTISQGWTSGTGGGFTVTYDDPTGTGTYTVQQPVLWDDNAA